MDLRESFLYGKNWRWVLRANWNGKQGSGLLYGAFQKLCVELMLSIQFRTSFVVSLQKANHKPSLEVRFLSQAQIVNYNTNYTNEQAAILHHLELGGVFCLLLCKQMDTSEWWHQNCGTVFNDSVGLILEHWFLHLDIWNLKFQHDR